MLPGSLPNVCDDCRLVLHDGHALPREHGGGGGHLAGPAAVPESVAVVGAHQGGVIGVGGVQRAVVGRRRVEVVVDRQANGGEVNLNTFRDGQ